MLYQMASMLICLVGAGVSATAIILSSYVLLQKKHRTALIYLITAALTEAAMIRNAIQAAGISACSLLPISTVILCILLILLHIFFIWDLIKIACKT